MKKRLRYISFLLCMNVCVVGFAQSITFNYKGDWSQWISICRRDGFLSDSYSWGGDKLKISARSDMSGIILSSSGGREIFSFYISNFKMPNKKERKQHLKLDQWYVFNGTVYYYVNDQYPTAEALAKDNRLVIPNPRTNITPSVQRHTSCTIKIAPFKKYPEVWNLWFDGIGVGISTQGLRWNFN